MTTHFRKMPIADERIHGKPVVFCVDATVVTLARAANNGATPATDAEVLRIDRLPGGVTGPETLEQGQTALKLGYGYDGKLTTDWTTIENGINHDTWFGIIGHYRDLPARDQNPGQQDVLHCVTFGPGPVLADALYKPMPFYMPVTMAEIRHFATSQSFKALGIVEYSHATKHGHVAPNGVVIFYTKVGSKFVIHYTGRVRFSASSTLATVVSPMVKITTGGHAGYWLNSASPRVHYTEQV